MPTTVPPPGDHENAFMAFALAIDCPTCRTGKGTWCSRDPLCCCWARVNAAEGEGHHLVEHGMLGADEGNP